MAKRILIVDDEPEMLDSLERLLRLEGWTVFASRTGSKALELSEQHSLDVAIIDFVMPEMDGVELLARLRKRHPHVRSILLSGKFRDGVTPQEVQAELKASVEADAVLMKPVSEEKLLSALAGFATGEPDISLKDFASQSAAADKILVKNAKSVGRRLKNMTKK